MLNPVFASILVLAALCALFIAARIARLYGVSPECSRKIVHVGMGTVSLTFPWLFGTAWPVLILAGVAAIALLLVRALPRVRVKIGCVLHDVQRHSYGEFAFIAGVACTFVLAHGNAPAYIIPVAVLTFADSLAAIVGTRFGTHRFQWFRANKTFEGSATFFAVAFACVVVPLAIANSPGALLVAFTIGVALMLIEAFSRDGLDNFAIPVIGGLMLRALGAGLGAL